MIKQQELIRRVTGKNRLSNIMLCCKTVLDLIPQVLLIHMIGLYFAASLTREQTLWECGAMLLCFIGKAVCAYSAIWTAHKAAYTCLTDLRLKIIRHLKKMSLGFFQERKTGDLTNIVQHDVEQVEGHLAHGLPETMSATILPAVVFLVMLLVDWRLALVMVVGLPLMWIAKKVSAPLWTKNFKIYCMMQYTTVSEFIISERIPTPKNMTRNQMTNHTMERQTQYGITGGDGEIVTVALSQVGNTGGAPAL